jgi:hypothetical protein
VYAYMVERRYASSVLREDQMLRLPHGAHNNITKARFERAKLTMPSQRVRSSALQFAISRSLPPASSRQES